MVFGVVTSDRKKMPPYFFKPGVKVGAESYYKVFRYHVLPWLKKNYPQGDYVWTQDGAPCHTATKVREFCGNKFADFWAKDFWPPSSPDLNPRDYAVRGVLEARVNKTFHPNTESLKTDIKEAWTDLSDDFIVSSCRSFCSRNEAVFRIMVATLNKMIALHLCCLCLKPFFNQSVQSFVIDVCLHSA